MYAAGDSSLLDFRLRISSANIRLNFHLIRAQGSCWYLCQQTMLQLLSLGLLISHIMILHPKTKSAVKLCPSPPSTPPCVLRVWGGLPKVVRPPASDWRLLSSQLTLEILFLEGWQGLD